MIRKIDLLNTASITKHLKVLYVEDNLESRVQTLRVLKNYFDYIDVEIDGCKGLEQYKNYFLKNNKMYDLVITDIQMKNMNGIEMIKAIYKINKEQKVIVISGYNDKDYLISLLNMGVEGFIQKPLSFEQISNILSDVSEYFKNSSIINLAKDYTYNKLSKEFLHNNEKIYLTINEYKFIEFLINNCNKITDKKDIFNYIYYDDEHKEFSNDSIKSLVKRLRKKIPSEVILYNKTRGYFINLE